MLSTSILQTLYWVNYLVIKKALLQLKNEIFSINVHIFFIFTRSKSTYVQFVIFLMYKKLRSTPNILILLLKEVAQQCKKIDTAWLIVSNNKFHYIINILTALKF